MKAWPSKLKNARAPMEGPTIGKEEANGLPLQLVEKPLGARGPQPPEAIIGFGDMRVKSAKSLA